MSFRTSLAARRRQFTFIFASSIIYGVVLVAAIRFFAVPAAIEPRALEPNLIVLFVLFSGLIFLTFAQVTAFQNVEDRPQDWLVDVVVFAVIMVFTFINAGIIKYYGIPRLLEPEESAHVADFRLSGDVSSKSKDRRPSEIERRMALPVLVPTLKRNKFRKESS